MKLSFNSGVYDSYAASWVPAYTIDYVIKNLAKIGYDGIELCCASPVAYPPYLLKEDRERIVNLLKENSISISAAVIAFGGGAGNNAASPVEAERKHTIKTYKDCIDLAYDLDSKICLYIAGWVIWRVSQDKAWEWSKQCLIEIAKYAKPKGISIAIEPTPSDSNLIETADDAIRLMKETKMDNVKLMFDTIHTFYRGDIPTDYVEKMGPDLINVHISDLKRMPPGSYSDFKFLIDALKQINYSGYLTMEVGSGRGLDGNEFAKKSFDYMKSIL